jgi:hypothetical protein
MHQEDTKYTLDMRKSTHRALVMRAYDALLSEGMSEQQAHEEKFKRAVENWRSSADKPGFGI